MSKKFIVAIVVLNILCIQKNISQSLPIPRNIQPAYKKGTRSGDGKPGANYWQNSADYNLAINFDPGTRLLYGDENINYTNSSPDTLRQIVFKLYPNLYKKGTPSLSRIAAGDLGDGMFIDSVWINDNYYSRAMMIDGTNMFFRNLLLLPKQSIHFRIVYHYTLNKGSDIRTGEIDPGADFVAYFFPRIAAYDDIDGWNMYPYNGREEFYNDFCHFKAAVTVPNNQVVWATGNLLNGKNVFSENVFQRIQQAEKNDAVFTIIDSTEISTATNHSAPTNTWMFEADNVTDFVFACSDHYMWHSSSLVVDNTTGRRTRADAVFNPRHKDYFNVINEARKTIEAMSFDFPKWPFPYPHETVFDGLDQMEYPMMVNDNPVRDHAESVELTDHEIFHTMFPFYMGINETKYAWMDEGWATIGEWIISPMIDPSLVDLYGIIPTERNAGNETDLPIITLSTETNLAYFTNSYPKPAMGYLFVKDILGDSLFTKALHYYIEQWHGKHPMPYDFFNCMNAGAGRNLNWFWKRWFFDNGVPDLAITSVNKKRKAYHVIVTSKGLKPVPVDLSITYADSSVSKIHRRADVWEKGNSTVDVIVPADKKIVRVTLGSTYVPDIDKSDNVYEVKN